MIVPAVCDQQKMQPFTVVELAAVLVALALFVAASPSDLAHLDGTLSIDPSCYTEKWLPYVRSDPSRLTTVFSWTNDRGVLDDPRAFVLRQLADSVGIVEKNQQMLCTLYEATLNATGEELERLANEIEKALVAAKVASTLHSLRPLVTASSLLLFLRMCVATGCTLPRIPSCRPCMATSSLPPTFHPARSTSNVDCPLNAPFIPSFRSFDVDLTSEAVAQAALILSEASSVVYEFHNARTPDQATPTPAIVLRYPLVLRSTPTRMLILFVGPIRRSC